MKRSKVKKETKEFSAAVGRALRRAAKVARKTARMYGTPIYVWKDAKSSRKNHRCSACLLLSQVLLNSFDGCRQSTGSEKAVVHRVLNGKDRFPKLDDRCGQLKR